MDQRLITNQKQYTISTEQIERILPITYTSKNNNKSGIGVIAQELQAIEPALVRTSSNGVLDVDYERLSIVLLAALKDMNDRLKQLEAKPKRAPRKKKV